MIIQWYPGHMAKAKRVIGEQMKVIDVVVELRDARIPAASANPVLRQLIQNKPRVLVLNKSDLADPDVSSAWQHAFGCEGVECVLLDSKAKSSRQELIRKIMAAGQPILQRWERRGLRARSLRTVILGIPNVGKSTLINTMARGYVAAIADRPGKTRGQQWVKIGKQLELMDTPGVLWPKFDDPRAARMLAATGAIADEVFDAEDVVAGLLVYLATHYPESLRQRYGDDLPLYEAGEMLDEVARKRGCLLPGGELDLEKARRIVLQDFRQGRYGRVSLELPEVLDEA